MKNEKQKQFTNGVVYAPLDGPPDESVSELPVHRDLFPVGFFKNPHHLHHNHETGMTIGTVHAYCNAVLWEYHGE